MNNMKAFLSYNLKNYFSDNSCYSSNKLNI